MDLKALVFNLDGTIYQLDDYLEVFANAEYSALKNLNPNTKVNSTFAELYRPLQMPNAQSRLYLLHAWGVDPDKYWAELHKLDLEKRKECLESGVLKPFEDVAVLKKLKNKYKLGLLTNTPEDIARLELAHCGIEDVFDAMVCAFYKDKFSKPEPLGAQLLLDRLGVLPEEAIIIGDSDVDIETGATMNMHTILKRDSHYLYDGPKADYKISTFDDLLGVLACFEI